VEELAGAKSLKKQTDERWHGALARPVPLQFAEQLWDADELGTGLLNAAQGSLVGVDRSATDRVHDRKDFIACCAA
jgi:hypothetical protein